MENRAYALAAGLFTILHGRGALLAAMWFSGDTYERQSYLIESRYPVTGLNPQSIVKLRGVDVGRVENIEFAAGGAGTILVRIGVRAGTPITRTTTAQLRPQGITGLSYVMLDERGKPGEPLPPGNDQARIPMGPAFTEELVEGARGVLADTRQLMARLNTVLSDSNVAQIEKTLKNLESVTDHVSKVAAALEPAAKAAPAMVEQARRTFADVQPVLASANDLLRELGQRVSALDRMAASAEQVGTAAESMSSAVTADALPRINLLVDEMTRTAAHLDRLIVDLREQPSSVVFGAPRQPPGPGERGYTPVGERR
jgi:phospholipid/cholesterol/gamma-HCH transport system substrate-binding protein